MISRGNDNFIVRHYDWIVAGVAVLALVGAALVFVMSLGVDADADASAALAAIERRRPSESGVEKTDLSSLAAVLRQSKTPPLVAAIDGGRENALASERRLKCRCGYVMQPGFTNCPACKVSLVVVNEVDEAAKKADRWSARYGVAADDSDKDGDGFTNAEEYAAQTDPTDAKDHPDYTDSLRLQLPLKETHVPFVLVRAMQIPGGWRCEFFDPKRKDDYGRMGRTFTAVVGEEISISQQSATGVAKQESTGYLLKQYEQKEELRAITAGSSMKKAVDTSVAKVVRKSDGKIVELTIQSNNKKKLRLTPIDVQASLVYERMGTKAFEVVAGDMIDLNGTKFRIVSIKALGKGAEVVVENSVSGKRKTLKALE